MTLQKIAATATVASALLLSAASIASAQTTTPATPQPAPTPVVAPAPTTPGVPNTGAGGDATTNMLMLGTSALVVAGGGFYLARVARR